MSYAKELKDALDQISMCGFKDTENHSIRFNTGFLFIEKHIEDFVNGKILNLKPVPMILACP